MNFKKLSFCIIFFSLFLISLIPSYNIYHYLKKYDFKKVFNMDFVESYVNYAVLKLFNRSMDEENVITGKNGFLFLGNKYGSSAHKTNGIFYISDKKLDEFTDNIQNLQSFYKSQNIKFIFVIAPNKESVYKEYLPNWMKYDGITSTDLFLQKAKRKNINILDLRQTLIDSKNQDKLLYLKTDTHWNRFGASIAYNEIMKTIELKNINHDTIDKLQGGGDISNFLKINNILDNKSENFYTYDFFKESLICLGKINKNNNNFEKCATQNDINSITSQNPIYAKNNYLPVNNLNVLLIGDSFFNANTILYATSFKNTWRWHWRDLNNKTLLHFLQNYKPDIVIYQLVERDIFNESFYARMSKEKMIDLSFEKNNIIFDLAKDDNRYTTNDHFEINNENNFTKINVLKSDPQLILNNFDTTSNNTFVKYVINSDKNTIVQFFYKKTKDSKYNKNDVFTEQIFSGKNLITIKIPSKYIKNGLRIDPVSLTGNYTIRELKIYEE